MENDTRATLQPELAIHADRVSKVYESGDGVHELDLKIPRGSIFGFIGPSGSGKTTTVRLATGALAPTGGELHVLGMAPGAFDADMRRRLGYMPQRSVLYDDLSVRQNLSFFASLYGPEASRPQRLREMLDFVELTEDVDKKVSQISGGMRRRVSLAASLVHDPDVIFLDEPTAGIDPVLRSKFWDRFRDLKDEGRTLFVTTQYVGEAAHCDRVGVLAEGRLLAMDTPDGLRRNAFGGDVVDIEFEQLVDESSLDGLAGAIKAFSYEVRSARRVRMVVDEAAVALPLIGPWCQEHSISVAQAEEFLPPYDDVFVEIVSRYRDQKDEPIGAAVLTEGLQ